MLRIRLWWFFYKKWRKAEDWYVRQWLEAEMSALRFLDRRNEYQQIAWTRFCRAYY